MARIAWTPGMSVGVPLLDADHRVLIQIINDLDASRTSPGSRAAVRALGELARYAEHHFGREERVMAACAFPGLAAHRDEHRAFVAYVDSARRRLEAGPGAPSVDELIDYLVRWLRHHVLLQDMAYRPYAEAAPQAVAEAARSFPPLFLDAC